MTRSRTRVSAPTFEHLPHALGIGAPRPRLSFVTTAPDGWVQRAYELEATGPNGTSTTGRVTSGDSVLVAWPFAPLASRDWAQVRVRAWGADDRATEWSPAAQVEAGLLEPGDWTAVPVGPAWDDPVSADAPAALLRKGFTVGRPIARARLHVTAHGLYDMELNGRKVGDDTLSPGWTSYDHRLRFYTYDVTDHLSIGPNVIGAWLADGWYRGRLGFRGGRRHLYGERTALMAQLEIEHPEGPRTVVHTDPSWRSRRSPILATGLYDGEHYDARAELPGWSSTGYEDADWARTRAGVRDPSTLVAPEGPPVRCTGILKPVESWETSTGSVILDFGQNLVGRLRIRVRGRAGHVVRLRHAEVVSDGELATRPLRSAAAIDTYTLAGRDAGEEWEPRFTFHGFRYAEVTGWTGGDIMDDVEARVLHTDMPRLGSFECSDPAVNRLHENVVWSMRGNFLDVPTDCPQRDERLGWTGDIQVFAPTAAFLYGCTGMLSSWLKDLAAEQSPEGVVPWYVPYIPTTPQWTPPRASAVWGDASVLTPWDLYQATSDTRLLAEQYRSARSWVELVDSMAGEDHIWTTGQQLGDWLDPSAPPDDPAAAMTDPTLVATAYFARSSRVLSWTATVLGMDDDAQRYGRLADEVRESFLDHFMREPGRFTSDTPTAYALAICFDLVPGHVVDAVGERLAELIAKAGNRISTGFAGTPLVCDALTRTGQIETAYALLLERGCPSWMYAVDQGATTIWERWDSLLEDGQVNPGDMTSFNHYALGAVANWLHTTVAGLAPGEPGYRTIRFRPRPGGGITSATATHQSIHGEVTISWTQDPSGMLRVSLVVPTGTTGILDLAGLPAETFGPGSHLVERQPHR